MQGGTNILPVPGDLDKSLGFIRDTNDLTGLSPAGILFIVRGFPSILWLEAITSRTALEEHAYAKWGTEIRYTRDFWGKWDELYKMASSRGTISHLLGSNSRLVVNTYVALRRSLPIGLVPQVVSKGMRCANQYGCASNSVEPSLLQELAAEKRFQFQEDHIVPGSRGGNQTQPMCPIHNRQKQDNLAFEPGILWKE